MARKKNALTEYYVAPMPIADEEPEYNELADWISSVNDDTDEESEDTGYYSGDGTPETDVISVKKKYTFEGLYDETNPAMKFIAGLEFVTGEERKIMFKQVRTDGKTLEGPATVTEPKVTGGEATVYAPFSCAIAWNKKPTETTTP
ncbi:phage tail tube protein [Bacillus sp. FSL K6-3431]|uniref:phage tail tube protein n=1 Tax=Bacillus sp. FSL K6-3431 TaxID=2921500 RepID=UPI0030F65987